MTNSLVDFTLSPDIVISNQDHRTLLRLAMANTGHTADNSDDLLNELDRAVIVPDGFVPSDVVRMGSTVTFRSRDEVRTVQLVFPKDADISQSKVSILTPIGTALIGLRTGQSITWRMRTARKEALTVLRVIAPLADEPHPPAA